VNAVASTRTTATATSRASPAMRERTARTRASRLTAR
jgi:hypothetical protein